MKKAKFIKYLRQYNCVPTGVQKGSHARFKNLSNGAWTIVPMHNDIDDNTTKTICKQLGIPPCGNN